MRNRGYHPRAPGGLEEGDGWYDDGAKLNAQVKSKDKACWTDCQI